MEEEAEELESEEELDLPGLRGTSLLEELLGEEELDEEGVEGRVEVEDEVDLGEEGEEPVEFSSREVPPLLLLSRS